ncbi:outer membrane beta-barrel family protein [Pedobacter punctiformis]|uniref:Outer membrane beta-barrel family protein n=1 Tax=Pedobacter punctiformis TaxID=3004097 RepID=A0ABT4L5W5_9SPHI|nr:outer membrane beta-barrel family protein [Pedobacter sp. HCMS5-2]MCZ4243319.1 outer membrane beta-barrel family protein [Pedobacter sp. HCMS5-2]
MRKTLLLLCFFLSLFIYSNAQNQQFIKGRVIDTASTSILSGTSVSILRAKDSTLVKFTRALDNGTFEMNNIPKGKYILLVSYPKYADFVDHFTLDSIKPSIDYGKINLTGMAKILADVIIKGNRAAIKIKGDTTEFDPKAYNIEPNSKVEDLIRQFPGIQIDKDGKITAQGQANVKVLVDGEEFFGDDPTLVTKNIRADMVDKVQLYDKKSDQATFTGIDDGEKTKTLNIKLKEDKKNGYFGKVTGSYGTDDFYQGQAMFNKFWGKKKFSAYGIAGNTGQVGLGWQDSDKYGSNNMQVSDDGGIYFYSGGGDDLDSYSGQYNGRGIPIARSGGMHFDSKWNGDKESLNTNYKVGSMSVRGTSNTINQNNLSSGVINSNSDQNFDNDMFRQKLDATYEVKLDSTLTLKVNVDGTLKNSTTITNNITTSTRGDNTPLNKSSQSINNNADDQQFNINVLFTKRLKKKGRTLSLNLSQSASKNKTNGYLNTSNDYYNLTGTAIDSSRVVNQYKVNDITNNVFKSNLAYTEPLSPTLTVIVNYGLNIIGGKSDRKSFNKSGTGNYDVLDTDFSNDYELNQIVNQGGAIFNYKKGKTIINFGSKISGVNFKQADLYHNKTYNRSFINYMPQASYQYRFSQQKSFRLNYNGNTNQPSLDQLQPIRVNTNPLNEILGNADLRPSFRSNLNASYNSYKVLTNESIWVSANYGFTANPIISDVVTNLGGASKSRFVNLTDRMTTNFNMYANYGQKIKGIDLNAGIYGSVNGSNSYNYITTPPSNLRELNKTENYNYSGGLNISKYKEKKYNFWVSFGPSYNVSKASVQKTGNSSGWGWNGNASTTVQLPGKFEISTDGSYQFNGKTQTFDENFERFIWNASLTKKFFKGENLKVSISGNDLLNQNVGFSRSAYNGNISQNSYTTIQRYFMFNVTWDFNKMGGGVKK